MLQTVTTEQRVDIARQFVARVFNAQDAERARDFFTADVTFHALTLGTLTVRIEVGGDLHAFGGSTNGWWTWKRRSHRFGQQ
jgi:hypothetical protein